MALRRPGWRALVLAIAVGTVSACGFTGVGTFGAGANGDPDGSLDGAVGSDGQSVQGDGSEIMFDPLDGGADSSADGPDSADAADSGDSGVILPCPVTCTSCTGNTCNIDCNGACPSPILCPPGRPCHVRCLGFNACTSHVISCTGATSCNVECTVFNACVSSTIECGNGDCRVECNAASNACVSTSINGASAKAMCLQCRGAGGQPGCVSTDCAPSTPINTCHVSCAGGGCNALGNGFNGCTDMPTCPPIP